MDKSPALHLTPLQFITRHPPSTSHLSSALWLGGLRGILGAAALVALGSVTAGTGPLFAEAAADWPQLLGPQRSGVYQGPPLARDWAPIGPRIVWTLRVGQGFAGPVIADGRLILFHRVRSQEVVTALDPETGKQLWAYAYPTAYRDQFGFNSGPRATPTVAGGRVFAVGAEGRVTALDAATGALLWSVDAQHRFQAPGGYFGAACSPLVVAGKVIVAVGGSRAETDGGAGIVAFDVASGAVVWTATDDEASYSSPTLATIAGRQHLLVFTRKGLVDLDPETGKVRFEYPFHSRNHASVNAAVPLVVGQRVFLSASYGTGAVLLDIGGPAPREIWRSSEALSNHYATSVVHDGYLYGFHGRQEARPSLRAVELATGKVAWSEERFGSGTLLLAGDDLLILRENGELILAPATPAGYKPATQGRVVIGQVFAYPALADGRLYARSEQGLLFAVDLRPRAATAPDPLPQ